MNAIAKKLPKRKTPIPYVLDSPADVSLFCQAWVDLAQEALLAISLTSKHHVISSDLVALGTLTTLSSGPREVFRTAIMNNASSLILVHNHPSGNPTPSRADKDFTRSMVKAGNVLGIPVLDHIILGLDKKDYYSLRDQDCVLFAE